MLKHTKIVATVSDQRCDVAFVEALDKAGMNVDGYIGAGSSYHDEGKQGTDPFQEWRDREGNR